LQQLFRELLNEDFSESDYTYLFTFRCANWIEKLNRTAAFFKKIDPGTPADIFTYWEEAKKKIAAAQAKYGDNIKPGDYKG